jgi:hypothetical protein
MRRVAVVMAVAASILGGAAATATTLKHAAPAVELVAPVKVEDTCACGGQVWVIWTIIYFPGGDSTQPARCIRHWSNGAETDTLCW